MQDERPEKRYWAIMDNRHVDKIETRVQAAINEGIATAKRERGGDAVYTRAVKESLTRLGQELGYVVCASECKGADNGEWLFDLTWMERAEAPYRRHGLHRHASGGRV